MAKNKVLIIGGSGQVGSAIYDLYKGQDNVLTTYRKNKIYDNSIELNIANAQDVANLIKSYKPNVIFLPASLTNVDFCEKNPGFSFNINVQGVLNVLSAISPFTTLVYFSSDYIFQGPSVAPLNVYGQHKLLAEHAILSQHRRSYIIRTNLVYGPDPQRKNYILRNMDALDRGEIIKAPIDEWVTPTYAPDLAKNTLLLLGYDYGAYHLTGNERTNRFYFLLDAARVFGKDEKLIQPERSINLGRAALRPINGGLESFSLLSAVGYTEGLQKLKELENAQ